ncbi:hypothetical protein WOC76_13005 [Methylocystis sp. IM3]|uniref:hypothetical protein n=1 Tax=unclassified Methylocystis TaxID=2625913 RepID=UPI000F9112EA|nr:MAG: hypothetical protein EKK29_05485 [Hyphomicrobiales bacterium]
MTTMDALRLEEQAQDERMIQSQLGKAIHHSLKTIIQEPLPNRMALLLLRLALAESAYPADGEEWRGRLSTLMDAPETELDKATRHVAKARLIVSRQRERIAELQAEHRPTEDALRLMDTFSKTLANLEYHLRLLREEAEGKGKIPEWMRA